MPLHKLKDFYPNYQETLADGQMRSIDAYSVQTQGGDKIGSAKDILVDDSGRFRYLVVDTGSLVFGKSILLPIGLANFDYGNNRIYVNGLSKSQVENLPEYKDSMVVDEHHEEQVRNQYRPISQYRSGRQFVGQTYAAGQPVRSVEDMAPAVSGVPVERAVRPVEDMAPIDADRGQMLPLEGAAQRQQSVTRNVPPVTPTPNVPPVTSTPPAASVPPTSSVPVRASVEPSRPVDHSIYDRDQALYGYSEEDNHGPLRLYEERLIAHRNRNKVGEVAVGKRVVTETAEITEPVERERVVIERHDATNPSAIPAGSHFQEEEVARLEIYEEQVSVEKQAFVREEVTVRKEVDRETVTARDQVRREELDVRTEGNPHINQ
ncbi:MAG TPA: PRC and DUF2382 domain-containing protein [Leptolyngbyaceae cyanobacterium]